MRMRWLKITAIGLLAVVIILTAAVLTVARTETGAGWVLGIAQDKLDGLEIGSHSGSLHDGLDLQQIGFSGPAFKLQADSLRVAVRTKWFPFVLRIEWLEADGLVYQVQATAEESAAEPLPEAIEIPVLLELPHIQVSGFEMLDEDGGELFAIRSLAAAASVFRKVKLHELQLVAEEGTIALSGNVALQNPFPMDFALQAGSE